METKPVAVVLGRFPPPLDGQALATRQCAEALEEEFDVTRFNTEPGGPPRHVAQPRLDFFRVAHFFRLRGRLKSTLAQVPGVPVVWHSISPAPLGHLRDLLATLPAFGPTHKVAAVLHRALFEALFEYPVLSRSAGRLVDRLSTVVFQSSTLSDRLASWIPKEKRQVIPNTIPDDLFFTPTQIERRLREHDDKRPLRLLLLSNLMPEKGYRDVLAASRILVEQGILFTLTLAGGWPDAHLRREAEEMVRAYSLPVLIRGPVQRSEVRQLHFQADIFLLPTYHPTETQPIAIIEALGAGTPVITCNRDVLRDMIDDGVEGRLVPARAPEAIAQAVADLRSRERWVETALAARSRFEATFAPLVVRRQWQDLARRLHRSSPGTIEPVH